MDLGCENEQLKDNIASLHNFVEHNKRVFENNESNYLRKIQYLQKDLEEYEKRENIFTSEIN